MTWNENYRFTIQDDLSWTKGRHNLKFGFFTERDAKTEPGSATYAGVYDFGHSGDNPLSTGNGYANALLGVFTTYTTRDGLPDDTVMELLRSGQTAERILFGSDTGFGSDYQARHRLEHGRL